MAMPLIVPLFGISPKLPAMSANAYGLRCLQMPRALLSAGLLLVAAAAQATPLAEVLEAARLHPSIRARQSQAQAAQLDVEAARQRYLGRGSLIADQTRYDEQRIVGAFYPGQPSPVRLDDTITRYGLTYSVPIDLFGVIDAARSRALANQTSAELLAQQEVLLRQHQALAAYVRQQASLAQHVALTVQRQRVQTTLTRIEQELALGRVAGVDLKLAQSNLARLHADEARLQGSIGDARAELMDASGQDYAVDAGMTPAPPWSASTPEQALTVRLAQNRSDALQQASLEAQRSQRPAIHVAADYLHNRGGSGDTPTWALGLRLALPLDASAHTRAQADAARAAAAQDEAAASRQTAQRQFSALHAAYNSALADAQALEQEVAARDAVLQVEQERWQLGAQTLENLLRQRRDLLDAQYRLADARARAVLAWSSAQVLGGTDPQNYIAQLQLAMQHPLANPKP